MENRHIQDQNKPIQRENLHTKTRKIPQKDLNNAKERKCLSTIVFIASLAVITVCKGCVVPNLKGQLIDKILWQTRS